LSGSSFAGAPFQGSVNAGECVRIMTGGVVPPETDTIVMQEHVEAAGDTVRIGGGHKRGQHLRRAGEDLKTGQAALQRGAMLRPAEIGMIASLGIGEVSVYRRLRVAFFSTGDELRSIGTALGAGQIYDSNRYTIHGMLTRPGVRSDRYGRRARRSEAARKAFGDAAQCADVVITSGGVSVGEADFVKDLLERLGEVVFWKIAMKPGRPARIRAYRRSALLRAPRAIQSRSW
jgi:molybdopterin molybdotransferase